MNHPDPRSTGGGRPVGRLRRGIVYGLLLVLMVTSLSSPANATWTDKSGSLPGTAKVSTGAIIALAAAGAAAVALVLHHKLRHKEHLALKREAPLVETGDLAPSMPTTTPASGSRPNQETRRGNQPPGVGKVVGPLYLDKLCSFWRRSVRGNTNFSLENGGVR